ncbi:MAG: hypothetical protein EOO60_03935 [Hymenobacter sp.]|nr:MAG: hypothetical protein EOO60_03935 [Hymenobacter sp.]
MIIYIDENMPPALAAGLNELQAPINAKEGMAVEIRSIKAHFGLGTKDEDWIPVAGSEGACIITRDFNIHRTRQQKALCEKHGIGMFFLRSPSAKKGFAYWDMVKFCVETWIEIIEIAHKDRKPFSYLCTPRKKFSRI